MQKLQDSVFSIVKTTGLSPAVFSFLQPSDDFGDNTPLGGILQDTKHGWLALGPKFCVIDLRTGLKIAARTFGSTLSNNTVVTSVVELPTPLTPNSNQLLISLQCDDISIICILHINGSQILRCIQTDIVITQLAVCDRIPDGPFSCFDGVVMAGTRSGEIFVFDLNRACLIQALKDISQGYEHLIQNEANPSNLNFLPLNSINRIEEQRELAVENDHHLAILLNENSFIDNQYIFRNPDGGARMKAKRDHIRVTVLKYIPQLGSLAVGFNFGAFQIWNILNMELEFTSQVNVECLPVTHFGFQEPCDDPRAFCYLWVIFSVVDRFEEEEFPLAVMYSLTYQGKRMLSDNECLYQDFSTATIRFQVELSAVDDTPLLGGKCIACHTYSIKSTLGDEGEDSMLNICQLVWECWGENVNDSGMEYGMLLFDLDQWYKDQMPATYKVESNAFMSAARWAGERALHARLAPASIAVYSHATRLEEHFYPNSLQYNCICLNTSEVCVLSTQGIQRQIISSMEEIGPTVLLNPLRLYNACVACGLTPLYTDTYSSNVTQEDQRRYLLSVALEARLSRFLKRCANDWATGTHNGIGCSLMFLVDWCWKRAIELKENAKELTAPLFVSAALPDRNVVRCLEHCVQQLTQLTGLMDAILTKCCNLVVPDALSEMEERHKGIATVSLYFQVVQWFLRVGLLPERHEGYNALSYPAGHLYDTYNKRRMKLNRLQDNSNVDENRQSKSCSLLYIDQLIEHEFGGDRIHQMWIKGGSECSGLYPPPSLYSLLRLYLLPEIPEEQKHSLVLYLLVDYSMIYDDVRYESVIRRLMQFPTMFGLSNTAIKATQAFWHLDHRDFDFALDQLQCLTGNTLSEWQHRVVLSSLLAQNKTQAALQYLHVRKPAPIQNIKDEINPKVNDHDKLEDWQSCCNLYLARGLVYEALDVVRMCVQNTEGIHEKAEVLTFFFKGCRNTGNLSKVLQVTLQQFEEEVFIKYLEGCKEPQTSDILVMYFLQQSRYLEAERYNDKLKSFTRFDVSRSMESLNEANERHLARDYLVKTAVAALPKIASDVARAATLQADLHTHVSAPKPMSVYVRAKSPKNKFTYKSSFIQDTIENASETWINKPTMRKGLKRALNIEETPFICTPKLNRTRSIYTEQMQSESTPPKRAKLDFSGTPKTPKMGSSFKLSEKLSSQMEKLLEMPEVQSPVRLYTERAGTPHSILKIRRNKREDVPSPCDSRYLGESDDEMLETASNHTHYSDSTNKHLRFTIPPTSESGSSPSPADETSAPAGVSEREKSVSSRLDTGEKEMDVSTDSFTTTTSHGMNDPHPLESPPKKQATEENIRTRKSYKDNVRARRSLSISANSSLSDDPNASIESISDLPITLINPRYSGEKKRADKHTPKSGKETDDVTFIESRMDDTKEAGDSRFTRESGTGDETSVTETKDTELVKGKERDSVERLEVPRTPRGRRGIRSIGESTPLRSRSGSGTPERIDSPIATPLRRLSRSRSKTPEVSPRSSPLAPILELPKQEGESEQEPEKTTLFVPRQLRSRSKTPERIEKGVSESPRLEAIKESPTKSSSSSSSPSRRSLRSRSRTPEVEVPEPSVKPTPRSLRSRSKTPEKLMSPKKDQSARGKKSLSRLVLEANTFKAQTTDKDEPTVPDNALECTPMKTLKQVPSLMDVTLSPIVNKSVLQVSTDSVASQSSEIETSNDTVSEAGLKSLPAFATLHETYFQKSVLKSYQSSAADSSESIKEETLETNIVSKSVPAFTTINEDFNKSVLHSYDSSVGETSQSMLEKEKDTKSPDENVPKSFTAFSAMIDTDFEKSVLRSHQSSVADKSSLITNDSDDNTNEGNEMAALMEKEKIVEIEREINEIEDMSNDSERSNESEVEAEQSEETEDSSSEESSADASEEDIDNDVISIEDSDSDSGEIQNQLIELAPVQVNQYEDNIQSDPLNQVSLLTDDNSAELDQEFSLNYSEDNINPEIKTDQDTGSTEIQTAVQIEVASTEIRPQIMEIEEPKPTTLNIDIVDTNMPLKVAESDRLDDKVMDVDYNKPEIVITDKQPSIKDDKVIVKDLEPKSAELKPAESDNTNPKTEEPVLPKVDDLKRSKLNEPVAKINEPVAKINEPVAKINEPVAKINEPVAKINEPEVPKVVEPSKVDKTLTLEKPGPLKETASDEKPVASKTTEPNMNKAEEPTRVEPFQPHTVESQQEKPETMETEQLKEPNKEDTEKPAMRTRKRAASTTSSKSKDELDEPRTPITRKRTQSNASNKSEEKTPETPQTPKRRGKTPELRKIITRRVSREMADKLDESNLSIDESLLTTPKRNRSRKLDKIDDNESVASESSFISNKSKVSDDSEKPSRKGRKSTVVTKPDLSVIPEVTTEESARETTQDLLNEYSNARRLTRNQKAVLSSLLESSPSRVRGRSSRASRSSLASEADEEERTPAFDVQTIDRITLLNKTDFEGSPDHEELQNMSPESIASEASKMRRNRMSRASSETKTMSEKKPAKINRRGISIDVVEAQESPVTSPARGRRASFNRACEALSTPKGRRTSIDVKQTESPVSSPTPSEGEAAAAARRGRRASTQSNTSVAKSDSSRRSKKMAALEEVKETTK